VSVTEFSVIIGAVRGMELVSADLLGAEPVGIAPFE
jgi:hypothetical protein